MVLDRNMTLKIGRKLTERISAHFETAVILKSFLLKLGYSEKATKFETIFHLKFDATQ